MGILGKLFKSEEPEEKEQREKEEFKQKVSEAQAAENEKICSACNQPGANKKFGGQNWHKQCLRRARKMAKKMV